MPTPPRRALIALWGALLWLPLWLNAQNFTLTGTVPPGTTGEAQLTLLTHPTQTLKCKIRKNHFTLQGEVPTPTIATLHISHHPPCYLWIENTQITIQYNPQAPTQSRITGSKTNSQYRYALEQCQQQCADAPEALPQTLLHYAHTHLQDPYTPFLLWLHYHGEDADAIDTLCHHLTGAAREAYHLPLLQQRAAAMRATAPGHPLPTATLPTPAGPAPLHTLLSTTQPTIILIAPQWMMAHLQPQVAAAIHRSGVPTHTAYVAQDADPMGWDATYMQQWDIHHLPYLFIITPDGTISARDISLWQIEEHLRTHFPTPLSK